MFTTDSELDRYFADQEIGPPPELFTDLHPGFEYAAPYGLSTAYADTHFPMYSVRKLPRFEPPFPEEQLDRLSASEGRG